MKTAIQQFNRSIFASLFHFSVNEKKHFSSFRFDQVNLELVDQDYNYIP